MADYELDPPILPEFVLEPQDAFVVKNIPAKLTCAVRSATEAHFKCNGEWLSRASATYEEHSNETTGERWVIYRCSVFKKYFFFIYNSYKKAV